MIKKERINVRFHRPSCCYFIPFLAGDRLKSESNQKIFIFSPGCQFLLHAISFSLSPFISWFRDSFPFSGPGTFIRWEQQLLWGFFLFLLRDWVKNNNRNYNCVRMRRDVANSLLLLYFYLLMFSIARQKMLFLLFVSSWSIYCVFFPHPYWLWT